MKSLEALIRGYLFYRVNGERFWIYNSARNKRISIEGNVAFEGYHIFKGWTGFFYRFGVHE
jgi:hypothetical protein